MFVDIAVIYTFSGDFGRKRGKVMRFYRSLSYGVIQFLWNLAAVSLLDRGGTANGVWSLRTCFFQSVLYAVIFPGLRRVASIMLQHWAG